MSQDDNINTISKHMIMKNNYIFYKIELIFSHFYFYLTNNIVLVLGVQYAMFFALGFVCVPVCVSH